MYYIVLISVMYKERLSLSKITPNTFFVFVYCFVLKYHVRYDNGDILTGAICYDI